MKKNRRFLTLIISVLAIALIVVACKKTKTTEEENTGSHYPKPSWHSPEPGTDGTLPEEILPDSLQELVYDYFTVYSGDNPPMFTGQFVSRPHVVLAKNYEDPENPGDTVGAKYNPRMVYFYGYDEKFLDFCGKQYDDSLKNPDGTYGGFIEEVYRRLYVLGTGEGFTCYYLTEGYPDGMYAKQSTVFSGKWNETYGGLKDFKVAVILLETSGNENLLPEGSFRVLGDGDGLAIDSIWNPNLRSNRDYKVQTERDPFYMFRKR